MAAAVVVKRWEKVRDGLGKPTPFVLLDNGNYRWDCNGWENFPGTDKATWLDKKTLPDVHAAINGTLPPTWEAGKGSTVAAQPVDPNAIVRRWEKVLSHAPKFTFVQYANLECEWDPCDGLKHSLGRQTVDYWRLERGDVAKSLIFDKRLRATWAAPGWEGCAFDPAPNGAPPVGAAPLSDRCKYAGATHAVNAVKEDWGLTKWKTVDGRTQTVPLYSAPMEEQLAAASSRVVANALRTLREMPLCNVSGMPITIIAKVVGVAAQAFFDCEHCK